jgi:hypothetical protein
MPSALSKTLAEAVTPGLDPGAIFFAKEDGWPGQARP